jgi:hypothetical protein
MGRNSGLYRLLLACGLVGPVLFNLTYLIEGVTRPGYDGWREAISALSLGDGGWVQIVNFIVFGLLIIGFGIGLRFALTPGVMSFWAPLLQILTGLGLIVAGIFTQDPTPGYPPGAQFSPESSTHALVHLVGTIASLSAQAVWCFVMARRFAVEPRWRGWAAFAIVIGILTYVCLTAFGFATANHGPAGMFERLAIIITVTLNASLSARLLAGAEFSHPNTTALPQ